MNFKPRLLPISLLLLSLSVTVAAAGLYAQQSPAPAGTTDPTADPSPTAATTGPSPAQSPEVEKAEESIQAKNFAAARATLEPYLATHPNDARALFDLGYIDDSQDHPTQAEADYRKAIAADPSQFESHLALGLLLARTGADVAAHADEARKQIEAATKLEPAAPNPNAQAQAFRTLAQLDRTTDPSAAKAALLGALKLGPEAPGDTLLTAEIAEAGGDDETAEEAYRQAMKSGPNSSPAVAGLVHLLLKDKKYDEAEPLLHTALLRDPDDPALNGQLAATLEGQGKHDEAIAALEKLHTLQPGDRLIAIMLAEAYTHNGNPPKADPIYAALLKQTPHDADILISRGDNLIRQGRAAEAVPLLQEAVKLKPDDGEAWSNLAFASSESRQYLITLEALSMRSKYASETAGTDFLWATAYDSLHQTKSAVEFYRKFLLAAGGKFPDQEWQARQRLTALERMH